jgi:RNA polymerase sigma factor (sigma-70 family)
LSQVEIDRRLTEAVASYQNPFADQAETDLEDRELVLRAQEGDRGALERLLGRHQIWIYNLMLRMICHPHDAEDATQDVLILVVRKLGSFEGRSSFRTWLYRMVVNHALNYRRRGRRQWTFTDYAELLAHTPELDFPDTAALGVDAQLLVEEAEIGCTTGMLLCLDPGQRLVYILGEIFTVGDAVAGELLEISPANFRQRLHRARRDLHSFMHDKCGLVNVANPCRCSKKTQGFIDAGYVDPGRLVFARDHLARVKDVAPRAHSELVDLAEAYAGVHRKHPFQRSPNFVAALKELLDSPEFQPLFARKLP